jgi:hypothetical protein
MSTRLLPIAAGLLLAVLLLLGQQVEPVDTGSPLADCAAQQENAGIGHLALLAERTESPDPVIQHHDNRSYIPQRKTDVTVTVTTARLLPATQIISIRGPPAA